MWLRVLKIKSIVISISNDVPINATFAYTYNHLKCMAVYHSCNMCRWKTLYMECHHSLSELPWEQSECMLQVCTIVHTPTHCFSYLFVMCCEVAVINDTITYMYTT